MLKPGYPGGRLGSGGQGTGVRRERGRPGDDTSMHKSTVLVSSKCLAQRAAALHPF